MKKSKIFLLFILMAAISCSLSSVQQANVVDQEFTSLVKQYNSAYAVASPVVQERWRDNIDPILLKANNALDVYLSSIKLGSSDAMDKYALFLSLKSQLIRILSEEGVFKND